MMTVVMTEAEFEEFVKEKFPPGWKSEDVVLGFNRLRKELGLPPVALSDFLTQRIGPEKRPTT